MRSAYRVRDPYYNLNFENHTKTTHVTTIYPPTAPWSATLSRTSPGRSSSFVISCATCHDAHMRNDLFKQGQPAVTHWQRSPRVASTSCSRAPAPK